ncbi:DMT family transporter [Lysobacter antibioticus]|jgi:drug/metabolite transporter (DMT)-like permease|uniref:EamA-like transporter family protein n=1 Tax=Lysobacter antibioticus TaxID=84531 RepID=A0A0S2FG81_LYSAN|nr:DMT family transporter [Lysobacter antibioticus]ALN82545.1 eamA-like transporter family protein [Lysobacter antibioticus]
MNAVSPSESRSALIQLLIAELLIGSVGVFVHESGQDAITAVLFRCVFGSAFLIAWGGARGLFRGLLGERALIRSAIFSGVLLVLNWVALFAGMARSSIGVATMVYHFFPFVVMGMAAMFYGERTRSADLGWTAIAFVGVLCSADPFKLWNSAGSGYLIGVGLTFVAAILCGASLLLSRRISRERPFAVVLIQCLVGIVMLAPFADYTAVWVPGEHWFWLAGLGLIHSGVCYVLFYTSYPRLPVATIAVLAFIYPVIALLLDYLVYGHSLVPVQSLGVVLIVIGTLGVNLKWQWRRPQPVRA